MIERLFFHYLVQMKLRIFLTFLIFIAAMPLYAQQTDTLSQSDTTKVLPEKLKEMLKLAEQQKSEATDRPDPQDLSLGGMIIDQTISKVGRDFYEYFYNNWQEPEQSLEFIITIKERPVPSLGSIISIDLDGEMLWENRVQPRADALEAYAQHAVSFFYRYLANYQAIQQSLENPDQQGSGIF